MSDPKIVVECWTCGRQPLLICRINPVASDHFYRRPHYPHRAGCYEIIGVRVPISLGTSQKRAGLHRAAGHDVREVRHAE